MNYSIILKYHISSFSNLEEDSKAGETVANIQTLDLDIGENGQVELSLIKQTPAHSLFVLDASSGNIILQNTHNLDYETTKIYNIVLAAYDKGKIFFFTIQIIHINFCNRHTWILEYF